MGDTSDISEEVEETLRDHQQVSDAQGELVVSETEGYVGDSVTIRGRGLPADEFFEVRWHSLEGSWGVVQANEIVGPQYEPRSEAIATVRTDDDGTFVEEWTVPEDFGGSHRMELQNRAGEPVAVTEYTIIPWFELDRTEAPLGETFTIVGYGLGSNVLQTNYQVTWDNGNVGFMTGVQNRGTATARIRAAGPVGPHNIQVWRNHRGVPFLQNNTQSPYGPVAGGRQSAWTVEVTEPESEPPEAWMDELLPENPIDLHYPDLDEDTPAELEITPNSGQAGTTAILAGSGFPAHTEVDLVWYRHKGHRVKGIPITPEPRPDVLPTVVTDANGSFEREVEIPRDVGATRPITAEVDGRSVAVTGFMMQPSIGKIEPTEGPVGTDITIELCGVGWTEYENAQYFVYDNDPVGYVCGVDDDDEPGVTRTVLKASGEPGYHFIDVYPSLFRTKDDEPEFEVRPHLSYLENHPVRPLPALHFTFEVTE